MITFTAWLKNDAEDCGLCDPPLEAQLAVDFLVKYLLGDDWFISISESNEQCNSAAVFDILMKHSRKFRKEYRKYIKSIKKKRKDDNKQLLKCIKYKGIIK